MKLTEAIYGKVPPHAIEIEKVVLGVLMLERDAIDTVSEILHAECFYSENHQRIYEAILSLTQKSQPIDILTVADEMGRRETLEAAGGAYGIMLLTNTVTSAANIESHSRIILEKFMAREMIRVGGEMVQNAYAPGNDVFDLLDQSEESVMKISSAVVRGDMQGLDQVLVGAMDKIEQWRKKDSSVTGVSSGFYKLDRATRGWQPGEMIILAARPSVGKTSFALHLARMSARSGNPVAIWSAEMDSSELALRMLSSESETHLQRIQTGRLDDAQMELLYKDGVARLANLPIYFDDNSSVSMRNIRAKARKLKKKRGLGLIIIDYLQLVSGTGDERSRENEISKISREIKKLAKELKVPIIALSQLSREIEKRSGTHAAPRLSDLRESGAIEQDADVVFFLWGPTEDEIKNDKSLEQVRFGKIAKNRSGVLAQFKFEFQNAIQVWKEVDNHSAVTAAAEAAKATQFPAKGNWKPVPTNF